MDYNIRNKTEYDECIIHGICSINPALSNMQDVILVYMEIMAYYLLELADLGFFNEKIKNDVIEIFSGLTLNVQYNQENLNELISKLYENLFQTKEIYTIICKEKNLTPDYLKTPIKITKQFNIANIVKQAQKSAIKKENQYTPEQKKLLEALILILKSICLYMVELQELNADINDSYKELIFTFCKMYFNTTNTEEMDKIIEKSVILDHELMKRTFEARKAEFGNIEPTQVSFSTRPGKAILVAGANIKELELVLQATQDKGVDVYTHGQMIVGHTFPKLKSYPHLVGHYGKGVEHCIADFSSFPGAIFLTKLALYQTGHLYRTSVYTSDKIAQHGVITIKNNDFEPLIRSANFSEGFSEEGSNGEIKAEEKENVEVGIIEDKFEQKIHELADKIESKKIKHLIAIGVSDNSENQKKYFEKFLELIEDDCFIISASYKKERDNFLFFNLDYVFPYSYKTINILKERNVFDDVDITIFWTHCEPHTIPNLFMMKKMGINNIYFGVCPPNLINPALIESLTEKLNIRRYENPEEDLKRILGKT